MTIHPESHEGEPKPLQEHRLDKKFPQSRGEDVQQGPAHGFVMKVVRPDDGSIAASYGPPT